MSLLVYKEKTKQNPQFNLLAKGTKQPMSIPRFLACPRQARLISGNAIVRRQVLLVGDGVISSTVNQELAEFAFRVISHGIMQCGVSLFVLMVDIGAVSQNDFTCSTVNLPSQEEELKNEKWVGLSIPRRKAEAGYLHSAMPPAK